MTWRQIKPELFYLGDNIEKTQSIVTLEHIDKSLQPDGMVAQIFIDDHCYVLALRELKNLGDFPGVYRFKPTAWWFWEAVQAIKTLPHPDSLTLTVFTDGISKWIPVNDVS